MHGNVPRSDEAPAGEASLLARLRAGEDDAYAEVLQVHGCRLMGTARRLVGNEDDARDVVQESMLAAFRSIEGFEGGAALATWLHRIVVNAALMKLRAKRRRPETPVDALLPAFSQGGHFEARVARWAEAADAPAVRSETRALVRDAIARLPDGHRVALVLRDVEGRTIEEVAAALGTSPVAAKVRVHRARQALRALLEPHMKAQAI